MADLSHARRDCSAHLAWARIRRRSSLDGVVQASKHDLMARAVAIDLLQVAKRVGPHYEAAEYEDLSGEENLTPDRIIVDDGRSYQALP